MENKKILLYNITPVELKEMIISDLKIELEAIINRLNEPENYSVQEVAKLLDCSELTIYNYIKKGLIPAYRIGRNYIIKKTDYDNALKEVKSIKYKR